MKDNLPNKKSSKLVKIGDAAKRLGVSIDTLRRWEAAGKIPSHRTPAGTRLYSLKELNQAYVTHKKTSPNDSFTPFSLTENKKPNREPLQNIYRKSPVPTPNLASEILLSKNLNPESPVVIKNHLQIFTNNFHTLKTVFFTQIITVLSVLILFTLLFSLTMTGGYLLKPALTEKFAITHQGIISPFRKIALSLLEVSMPDKLQEIRKQFPPPNLIASSKTTPQSRSSEISLGLGGRVLAATTSGQYLQINAPTEINGPLFSTTLNTGFGDNELYPMNQPVLTTSVVTFGGLNLPVLTLTGPNNQLTLANTIISTQPGGSGAFTVSIPSLSGNGNFVIDNSTQTLTNKTISGSSNTFSNIPNSALTNSSVTISAGSGLSGGGTVSLGGSITLSATSQSGVTSISGTTNQVIASSSTGAVTLSLPQDIATTSAPTFAGVLLDGTTSGTLTLNAADSTTDYTLTLPDTAGTAGYLLTTDGSGNTSWTNPSGISVTWDSIDDPVANQTLNMSTYTTTWNSAITSGTFFDINANSLTNGAAAEISSTSTAGTGSGASYLLNLSRSGTNSNASHTAYGISSTISNTGATSTNIAGYFNASGASTNYGIYVASGNVNIQELTASSGVYTDTNKNLTSTPPSTGTLGFWTRTGTTLSPSNAGDTVSTSGSIGAGTTSPSVELEVRGSGTSTDKSILLTNSASAERFSVQDDGQLNVTAAGGSGRWIPGTGIYTYSLRSQNGSSIINLDGGALTFFDGNGTIALNLTDRNSSKLNGKLFIGDSTSTPTALLHLAAGTATAATAPLKFSSGTNLTTAEAGALEYNGTQLYFSPANNDRNILLQNSSSTAFTTGSIPFATTNGYLTEDNSNLFWDDSNNRLGVNDNTPSFSLDVTGTAQITGAATFGSTTTLNGITYTWPGSQSSGYVLSTNGSGTLSWTDPASLTIRWNTIDDPNGNQTLAMANNTTTWNWATATTGNQFTATANALTTGSLFNLSSTSTDGDGSKLLNLSRSGTNGTASKTNYGLYSDITNTGTTSTNIAGYFSASGATNNYAGIFENGNVGIGDTTPSSKLEVGDGTDSLQISSVGDITFVDANNSASITGPAGGSLNINSGSGQSIVQTASTITGTGTSSAFVMNASSLTSGTALYLTSTATSGKTIDINATQTSGTIFNLAYGSATTLNNDLTGLLVDLNSGNVDATNQNLTGVNFKIPTVTDTHTSGTKTLTGMLVNFGSGAGINQNGSGGTLEFIAGDFHLPALTQTAGTLNAYGTKVTTPATITTGGTAYGNYVSATGVGAGNLNALGISSITGGAGTEYALNIGSGWDAILRVGSTTVINGSGVTTAVGGGTGQSSYAVGDILYADTTTTLAKRNIGNPNEVLAVVGGVPTWTTISGSSCTNCLINNPTSTQTISPTNDSTGLSIRQTSAVSPTADIFNITDSSGATKYFYVDKDGNVSTGAISNTTLTLTPTTNTTALTLVGTNVTSAKNQYINTKNSSGTISDISYGASQTLSGSIIGHNIDLSTNVTATNQSATGYVVTLPSATNTSGTQNYKGVVVTGGAINENGGTSTTFTGVDVTIPALTQTSGTLTAYGTNITTPSSITSGGTAIGFNVSASGVGAGTLYGLNISDISAGAGTEVGAQIGSGWDTNLLFNDTTTRVAVANGGTITILDTAGNTLCTITDSGSTGNLNCTGNITGGGGTVGYWNRDAGTSTLSPATSGDNVTTSGNISTTGSGTITSAGLLTGSSGATISGATTSINASSNFATLINTGTSNGSVTIGNSGAGAINLASGAASSFAVTNANLTLNTTGASGANGRILINSALASGNTTTEAIAIKTTTDLGSADQLVQFGDSGGDFLTILGNGNVGIGTASPSNPLSVAGNSNFTGHSAIGANATVNSGSLFYGSTYENILNLQEEVTTASVDYVEGLTNYINLNPSATPAYSAYGIDNEIFTDDANNENFGELWGIYNYIGHTGTGTASKITSLDTTASVSNSAGNVTNIYSIKSDVQTYVDSTNVYGHYNSVNSSSGTITNDYGTYITIVNTGTITNTYGLYLGDVTSGTQTNQAYALYQADTDALNYLGGNLGIGDSSPTALLTVGSGDAFQVNSSGAIAAATGISSSGTINFSTLSASSAVYTDGSKNLTSTPPSSGTLGYWSRTGTTLSPATAGDNVTTTGNISTTSSGTITSAGLLTGSAGLTISGGTANINVSGTSNTAIGNSTGTFALTSSGGLNVTTGGALTGVTSIDTIATSATALTFAGAGTISSTTSSALTLDSGTTGAVNLGTSANAKTITVGNATGATALVFNSGTGAQTHTSKVVTGTTTSAGFVFDAGDITSGTGTYMITDSVTSGRILDIATSGNTWTGNGTTSGLINIASSSTAGTGSNSSIVLNIARSGANSNSSHAAYGVYSSITNSGTNSANYAGYFSSSGATNNYAIIVPSGGGNVGIGTTVPGSALQVGANNTSLSYGSKSAEFTLSVVASDSGFQLRNTAGNGTVYGMAIDSSDNLYVGHNNPSLILRANSSTISTINSAGLTISSGGLSIGGVSASSGTLATASHPSLSSPGAVCRDGSTGVYGQCASDARLKDNIGPITESGLDLINQLRPSHFDFKTGAKNQVGFIAQEVLPLLPQAVSTGSDGYYGLNDMNFTPYLVKAIQELDQKVENTFITLNSEGIITNQLNANKIIVASDIRVGGIVEASNFEMLASNLDLVGALSTLSINGDNKTTLSEAINLINNSQITTDSKVLGLETENASQETRINATNNQVLTQAEQLASAAAELANAKSSIANLNNDIADLKLTPSSVLESTESATFANINITEKASALNLSAIDATISGTFKALGTAILPSTTIAGDVTVDGTLSITEGNTLDVIGTLFLQKNALAENLDIFNGKVIIDKTGKIAVEELALGDQSVGEATIEASDTEITIPSSIVKTNSKVFITPTTDFEGKIIVDQITADQNFKVRISTPNPADVKFNWLIVGSK